MILAVCPSGSTLVPLKHPAVGQPVRYVGRTYDPKMNGWPADKEPMRLDTSKVPPALVAKLRKRAGTGDILPHDPETASELGVSYCPVEWTDGEWTKATVKTQTKRSQATGGAE
jgi:hypothetical protein